MIRIVQAALCLLTALALLGGPPPGLSAEDLDLPGAQGRWETAPGWATYIIPMDNDTQNKGATFNLKAYGLVNHLLWAGVPVRWAISPKKSKVLDNGVVVEKPDFTATVRQVKPVAGPVETLDFYAGPFLIDIRDAPRADAIIDDFNTVNHNAPVNVYQLVNSLDLWVRYDLRKPRVALIDPAGSDQLVENMLVLTGGFTPGIHYEVLNPLAGDTIPPNGCHTVAVAPHTQADQIKKDTLSSVFDFVQAGGNFVAQCVAVQTYENELKFQTDSGVAQNNAMGSPLDYRDAAALSFSQFHGPLLGDVTGHVTDFSVLGNFVNNGHVHVANTADPSALIATVAKANPGGVGSLSFYLAGHQYSNSGPDVGHLNGWRMVLNGIMTPATDPCPGQPLDDVPPSVVIVDPVGGAMVGGDVTITAVANFGDETVEFFIDGELRGADTDVPYQFRWHTTPADNGPHKLTARAFDLAGNHAMSQEVNVTVHNNQP